MIHFKNRSTGFTLIEVIFVIGIIAFVLPALIINQGNVLQLVARQSRYLFQTYAGENFMVDSYIQFQQDNSKRSSTKQLDDPSVKMVGNIKKVSPSIKKLFSTLFTQEVILKWEENGKQYTDKLVSFLFLPELKKE